MEEHEGNEEMNRRRFSIAPLGVLLALSLSPEAGAQGIPVEGVLAVVGQEPILRSEVEEQFEMLAPQFRIEPGDTSQGRQLRREILDNLINQQLLDIKAEKLGIEVDPAQVEEAVEQALRADRERLGPEGFARQIELEGLTESELRAIYEADLREEFRRRQLLQREVFSKVSVTEADLREHFDENRERIGQKPRALRVLDIFVRVTPDSVVEESHRRSAAKIREEILAGLAFDEAARRYSDDERSADQGGLLGRFAPGDLGDRSFEGVAFTLAPGEVSEPVRTNLGYHLVEVVDRDPDGAWTQARHILVGVASSKSDQQRVRQRVERIRERIVSGEISFAEAVRLHSQDLATREQGGDVGWLPIDNFLGETREAVDQLRVGEVSPVAAVEGGFHIFKLVGEQAETEYTFEEVRTELRNIVEMEERQKLLDEYLAELRNETYVEIRPIQ